ncbi:sensor histidine kinase [Seongchinamella sediminis]|uniref:sensor histidine kinase n=1 Tax=Seongchinamella sediminis TaxID=2283635 RepID=UPI0013C371C9|nr:ATP-binding protein [Seongchinamella sediminis]
MKQGQEQGQGPGRDAERYAFLVEESALMISTHNPGDWAYTSVNAPTYDILGYRPEEVMGVPAYFFFHPDDAAAMKQRTIPAVYAHGTRTFRYRFRHKSGHYLWLESTHRSIRDPDTGELQEIIAVTRDLTAQRQAEKTERERQQELIRAGRLMTMGEMATGLAHEINQPLATILNYSRGALRRIESGQLTGLDDIVPVLDSVSRQAQRAADIIKRLRSLVKKTPYQRLRFCVNETCRDVAEFLQHEWRQAGVDVELQLQEPLADIEADAVQIEQVLINLLRNAIEAYSGHQSAVKRITISTEQQLKFIVVKVKDLAGGITAEQQGKVFEPYYSTRPEGLGMGLSICRSIVEAHSGRIRLESDGQTYSCFELSLPLAVE